MTGSSTPKMGALREYVCDNCNRLREEPYPRLPEGWTSRAYHIGDGNVVVYFCSEECLVKWERDHVFRGN